MGCPGEHSTPEWGPEASSTGRGRASRRWWRWLEEVLRDFTEARLEHGVCPDCIACRYGRIEADYVVYRNTTTARAAKAPIATETRVEVDQVFQPVLLAVVVVIHFLLRAWDLQAWRSTMRPISRFVYAPPGCPGGSRTPTRESPLT